jgi:peroxiredoxin
MRIRFALLALLALAAGACATPAHARRQAPAAPPAPTATAGASGRAAGVPPPGLVPVARRRPAPELRVTAFDGRTVTLDGLRGRPVVVSFFASWCPNCRSEQPELSRVASQFAGRVGFVGVSYQDTVAGGRAYQRRYGVPYPLANDPSGRTWARWRVAYQPVVVLVDRQGRVAERFDAGTTGGTLRAALAYLVGE